VRDIPDVKVVGRSRELAMVRSWLAAETGGLVLCGGEPGIGKTRLAQELAGHALAVGREVVWGHCVETSGAPAFWPWRQVLKAAGADPDLVLAHDAEVPQDACASGRVLSFGKQSQPVVVGSKTPYVAGLAPNEDAVMQVVAMIGRAYRTGRLEG